MAKAGGIRMGGVFVEIGADAKSFFAMAAAVDRRLAKLGSFGVGAGLSSLGGMVKALGGIGKSVQDVGRSVSGVGTKMAAMGAAVAVPVGLAVKQFASFDDAIRATAAVTGSLGPDGAAAFGMLNDKARELGATTSFTAIEVAKLMTELGRAGFKPDEINNMTGAVLDLSRATGTDATRSAGIMAATLRQFELGATDAARAADILTYTANNTFNTVDSLGESLKYAGPVAKSLGMSLEDTTAILGALGNVGIQGSEAGTALRRLSVISAGAGTKLNDLFGVSNTDAAGNLKPLVQILDEINTATMDMPVAERTAKMAKAFGLLGITSANVLSKSAGGVRKLAEGLKTADGVANKTALAMDAGLGGSIRIALSAIEGTALALGDALAPSLQVVIGFLEDAATALTGFIKNNQQMVIDVAKMTALVIGGGLAIAGLGAAITFVGGIIGAVLSPLGLLAVGLSAIVVQTPELSAAFMTTFGEVKSIASDTLAGIYDAISGGDLGGAIEIAMTGMKSAFLAVAGEFLTEANNWAAKFRNVFDELGTSLFVGGNWLWTKFEQALLAGNLGGEDLSLDDKRTLIDKRQTALDRTTAAVELDAKNTRDGRTADAGQFGVDMRSAAKSASARLSELTTKARDRRILTAQADELIASIGDAKSLDDLRGIADQFFALQGTGMLTDAQQKKYGESVDLTAEKLTPTSTSGLIESPGVSAQPDDQERMRQATMSAASQQAEVAGTFSSVNLGGMGFGASLQQQQLDVLKQIKSNTDDISDEGAIAA